eukprot:Gb_10860 [translate_table: standard]
MRIFPSIPLLDRSRSVCPLLQTLSNFGLRPRDVNLPPIASRPVHKFAAFSRRPPLGIAPPTDSPGVAQQCFLYNKDLHGSAPSPQLVLFKRAKTVFFSHSEQALISIGLLCSSLQLLTPALGFSNDCNHFFTIGSTVPSLSMGANCFLLQQSLNSTTMTERSDLHQRLSFCVLPWSR